jgi:hypothetical protein
VKIPGCLSVTVAILLLGSLSPVDASQAKEAAAVKAALRWLKLVDDGNYGESWQSASAYFKSVIDNDRWQQIISGVRWPLGTVLNRTQSSTTYATELPGAPDGEYVVIQFDTSFENKRLGIETVTPMKDPDGVWRVSGYFIK